MASRTVAKQEQSAVPALYQPTAPLDIDGGDIALPRLRIGQGASGAVGDGLVRLGDLYLTMSKDDPDPEVLWSEGDEGGVLFSVLSLKRGKSLSIDNELETWDYSDPEAPEDAKTTYDYMVALPESSELPVKFMLKGSSTGTARQINLILAKTQGQLPPYALGFRLSLVRRRNDKGTFFVARATREDLTDDQIATAGGLAEMVASAPAPAAKAATEAPAI